jgi:hypothetical protein
MTMSYDRAACTSSPWRNRAILLIGSLGWALGGCVLTGIEPDEIDIADGTTGLTGEAGGDGDGDASTGDGADDPTTSGAEGDGDPSADVPCADFSPVAVVDGDNPIEVVGDVNLFAGSCGGLDGPDAIYRYESTVEGLVTFTLAEPEFDGVIYLAGDQCVPLDEWACDPAVVQTLLTVGQSVYIIVDSNVVDAGGSATLTISGP